jgi:predicted DNA-binding protein with PD1-like motif
LKSSGNVKFYEDSPFLHIIRTDTHFHMHVLTSRSLKQVYSGRNQEGKAFVCSVDGIV